MFSRLLNASTAKSATSKHLACGLTRQGPLCTLSMQGANNPSRYGAWLHRSIHSSAQEPYSRNGNRQNKYEEGTGKKSNQREWSESSGQRLLWGTTALSLASLLVTRDEGDAQSLWPRGAEDYTETMRSLKESVADLASRSHKALCSAATYAAATAIGAALFMLSTESVGTMLSSVEKMSDLEDFGNDVLKASILDKARALREREEEAMPEGAILLMKSPAGSIYFQPGTSSRQSRVWFGGSSFATSRIVIVATNLAVFLAWRIPSLQLQMSRHFTCSLNGIVNHKRLHTLVTAAFSHQGFLHLAFNMVAINSFLVYFERWSDKAFWTFYLGANAAGMLGHLLVSALSIYFTHRPRTFRDFKYNLTLGNPALGASSAACGMFAFIALIDTNSRFNIMFIPYPLEGSTLLKVAVGFDTVGAVMAASGSPFTTIAHGAHLLGYASGYLAYQYVLYRRAQLRRQRSFH